MTDIIYAVHVLFTVALQETYVLLVCVVTALVGRLAIAQLDVCLLSINARHTTCVTAQQHLVT